MWSNTNELEINNGVISNVAGVGLNVDKCWNVKLNNNVFRNVVHEVIRTTGPADNVEIRQTVITGDSQRGEGWMSLEGDSYVVVNTVATGAPKNGIVVSFELSRFFWLICVTVQVNGCNYKFGSNICTNNGNGYCIYLTSKSRQCRPNIGITNINSGGRGLYNRN